MIPSLDPSQSVILALLLIWSIVWKGFALWKAAKNNQSIWFICLLAVNTIGLLEIAYLWFFQKDKNER